MKNLAAALVAAQAEMPSIHKGGQNPHFRSRYVTLDDLIEATRPILNRHGIVVTQGGGMTDHGHPVLLTQLTHAESGEQMTWGMPLFLTKEDMQGLGSAITYARRYAWAAALGIASDEDDDANQASSAATKAPVASQAKSGVISEAQAKRLFAIAKENEVDAARMKEIIRDIAGVETSGEIPKSRYDEVVGAVELESVPFT